MRKDGDDEAVKSWRLPSSTTLSCSSALTALIDAYLRYFSRPGIESLECSMMEPVEFTAVTISATDKPD